MQTKCSENSKQISVLDKENTSICTHIHSLQEEIKSFRLEREEMKETILDLRCRSMKNNLIFTGLVETRREDTEAKLREFLRCELGIDYHIEIGNVHRFGSHQKRESQPVRKNRPIVARFIYNRDLQYVLESAKYLKGRPFGINQQFPAEIENRRRELYPIMKEAKNKGETAKMVRDKLFINNKEYIPEKRPPQDIQNSGFRGAPSTTPTEPRQRLPKRPRVGSTPERSY